jgi:hypothetical protein
VSGRRALLPPALAQNAKRGARFFLCAPAEVEIDDPEDVSENTAELLRLLRVNRLATEYWAGNSGALSWHCPSNAEPLAVVTYASEPSPETGHAGWCWWARGKLGEAPTYESAKRAAETVLATDRDTTNL